MQAIGKSILVIHAAKLLGSRHNLVINLMTKVESIRGSLDTVFLDRIRKKKNGEDFSRG